ncbi:putative Zn-dependent hydrolase of the beta-lactamase protein [Phyllosticta citribraziliensis]|uniref:Zn-dependent hydrolase of the beta-lactamase protein n=1 Tax=Phyllosticta citribraziliensis TaxID=989973 RepID=A0ABR1LMQ3_9PEZI
MSAPNKSRLNITHIGTATAILEIDGVNFLTDPFFSPAGSAFDLGFITLKVDEDPGLGLDKLPPIDAVLRSHEDHVDNLDELGRRLLDGRKVLTTMDGAKNLAPRPAVRGMRLWETITDYEVGGKRFTVTTTPCKHLPGGESTGFLLHHDTFGFTDGKPNAIWFSGDTVWIPELAEIRNKYHVLVAVLNLGGAHAPNVLDMEGPEINITMDGKQGARALRETGADVLVPMHFAEWGHFKQHGKELREAFEAECIMDKVRWLTRGKPVKIY